MKGALIALFIGITLLVMFYFKSTVYRGEGAIDIHLHDTYFVLSNSSVLVFVLLFLGTLFSLGGVIGTHFQNKWFWVSLILFLAIDTYCIVALYNAFKNTNQENSTNWTSENLDNLNK